MKLVGLGHRRVYKGGGGGMRPDDEGGRGGDDEMTAEEFRPVRYAVLRAASLPFPQN